MRFSQEDVCARLGTGTVNVRLGHLGRIGVLGVNRRKGAPALEVRLEAVQMSVNRFKTQCKYRRKQSFDHGLFVEQGVSS